MQPSKIYLALAALLCGSVLLGACGNSNVHTSSPSSTLGTDSSATKVGGSPVPVSDSTGTTSPSGTSTTGTTGSSQ